MPDTSRIGRLLARGRSDQTPLYAVHGVMLVVAAIVAVIIAAAFTLWALLN